MLTKWIFSFFMIACCSSFAFESNKGQNKVIVLVPGFFNSLAPSLSECTEAGFSQPYWSQAIVNTFLKYKVPVYVVNNLNPVGDLKTNGEKLIVYLNKIAQQHPNKDLYLVGHSAGGLYALYASSKTDLPIKAIAAISTPFGGIEFIDKVLSHPEMFQGILEFLHLESLMGLKKAAVESFKSELKIPNNLRLVTYGGFQALGLPLWDAKVLSTPLITTQLIINADSDGIVSWKSSFLANNIKRKSGAPLIAEAKKDYIRLEHWEQVLDHRFFGVLGILNLDYIKEEQQRFYTSVALELGF